MGYFRDFGSPKTDDRSPLRAFVERLLMRTLQIRCHTKQQLNIIFHLPKRAIAAITQPSTKMPANVAMVEHRLAMLATQFAEVGSRSTRQLVQPSEPTLSIFLVPTTLTFRISSLPLTSDFSFARKPFIFRALAIGLLHLLHFFWMLRAVPASLFGPLRLALGPLPPRLHALVRRAHQRLLGRQGSDEVNPPMP